MNQLRNSHESASSPSELALAFGFEFQDLYTREGLKRLDDAFLSDLAESAPDLQAQLLEARQNPPAFARKSGSELMVGSRAVCRGFHWPPVRHRV